MTTFLCMLLHIYQPVTQDIEILREIDKSCYKPLFSIIDKYDNAKFCLNINGVLVEMLHEFGLGDTMDLLKNLVSENKIVIVGTAKFHPILPLFPKKEVIHQIGMNEEINRKEFGNMWKRNGFFPPEMAISPKIAKIVYELGYKWIISSGIACPLEWPYDQIYCTPNGLKLFFRDDILSNKISFNETSAEEFVETLQQIFVPNIEESDDETEEIEEKDRYLIIAQDGETFGHHIKNYEKTFLGKMIELIDKEENIKTTFISELDQYFPVTRNIIPLKSSWSTTYEHIKENIPYPLWKHPENDIHKFYWKIMNSLEKLMILADNIDLTDNWEVENYHTTARYFYDRGLYSCPTWWANPFNGTWSPNLVYKGIELLMKASLNAQLTLIHAGINAGDVYFDSISYYHGLLLMELYNITKKNVKNKIID